MTHWSDTLSCSAAKQRKQSVSFLWGCAERNPAVPEKKKRGTKVGRLDQYEPITHLFLHNENTY